MTDTERSRIVELQHQGYGYKKISAITGLPLNTVKSFCARHPVQIKEMPDSNALCRNCLTPLEQTPHKRKRMFCSDACRMAWWNAHPERVQRKAYYTLTCRHCGKQFESYGNSHRAFCSRDCYLKFLRKEIDYDKRLFAYQMAMALARSMRSKGLISAKEYAKIDTIIANKYGISSCSIFR